MEGFLWIIIIRGIVWIVISRPNKTNFVSFGFQSFGKTKAGGRRAIVEDIRAFEHKNNLHLLTQRSIRNFSRSYKGIGDAKATTLFAALELGKRYAEENPAELPSFTSSQQVYRYIHNRLDNKPHEEFWAIYLNKANKVVATERVSSGGISSTVVDI